MSSYICKEIVSLYCEQNFSAANALLESLIEEKILIELEKRKTKICSEGIVKVNNKKKKSKLMIRAGKAEGGISAKHTGRTLFRSLNPEKLKSILATEDYSELDEEKDANYRDIHNLLADNGFNITNKKGSHIKYTHEKTGVSIPISHHNNIVSAGVVRKAKNAVKNLQQNSSVFEQFRPVGFHKNASEGLKQHSRITHPIQKEKRNRIKYKNLQNRLDRKQK